MATGKTKIGTCKVSERDNNQSNVLNLPFIFGTSLERNIYKKRRKTKDGVRKSFSAVVLTVFQNPGNIFMGHFWAFMVVCQNKNLFGNTPCICTFVLLLKSKIILETCT